MQQRADFDPAAQSLMQELEDYSRQIEAIKQDAEDLLRGMSEEQFNRRKR